MNNNLSKRIFTSVILATLLLVCLFFNKYSWLTLLIIASIICFFEFYNLAKKIWKKKIEFIYLSNLISFLFLVLLIYSGYGLYKSPLTVIIFALSVCIFSDIGGFFIGKLVGGKKLTKISPNKTVSGSIGSLIFSVFPLIIYFIIYNYTNNKSFQQDSWLLMFYISLILSFVCQAGDLFISYFKRKAKVKDTGSILPGHGGLLDRIDGIVFAVPSAFMIDKIFFNL